MLLRSGHKGNFVVYPKGWRKRWLSQTNGNRFQTPCDMLLGGCSCGRHHYSDDSDTSEYLEIHEERIESLTAWRRRTQ